jgi:chromate transporter
VLPLLQESVVGTGWVSEERFLAGYGASQAIPGPMFAFSAFLGSIIPSGHAGWLTAAIALIFMFLPGFLLVAIALPGWQAIAHKPKVANAIAGVNAAVVGILGAALYDPIFTSSIQSDADMAIAMVGFGMLAIWRLSPLWVVLWCVAASVMPAWV